MDPKSADALTEAFLEFDADKNASVAVFYGAGGAFCAGWDLKFVSTLDSEYPLGELDIPPAGPRGIGDEIPRGPLGPSRLELDNAHAKAASLEDDIDRLSFAFAGNMVATGVSAGVVILGAHSEARRALIEADCAMYVRKAQRRHERHGELADNMIDLSRPPVSRAAS